MSENAKDDRLHVPITPRLAEVLWLEKTRPTRRELAHAVADRASYETDGGAAVTVWRPKAPEAVAMLVSIAEYLDTLIEERRRISITEHAHWAAQEATPRGLAEMTTCLVELGFGGTHVAGGPLGRVVHDALWTRAQRIAGRLMKLAIEAGYLERV